MRKLTTKDIALLGISCALVVVLQALAEGLRILGNIYALALGLIPVLVVAQLKDWRFGVLLGTLFGLTSFTIATIMGTFANLSMWQIVVVCLCPRIFVGISLSFLGRWLRRFVAWLLSKLQNRTAIAPQDAETAAPIVDLMDESTYTEEQSAEALIFEVQQPAEPSKQEKRWLTKQAVVRFIGNYLAAALVAFLGVVLNALGFLGILFAFSQGTGSFGAYFIGIILLENSLIEMIAFPILCAIITLALRKANVAVD